MVPIFRPPTGGAGVRRPPEEAVVAAVGEDLGAGEPLCGGDQGGVRPHHTTLDLVALGGPGELPAPSHVFVLALSTHQRRQARHP